MKEIKLYEKIGIVAKFGSRTYHRVLLDVSEQDLDSKYAVGNTFTDDKIPVRFSAKVTKVDPSHVVDSVEYIPEIYIDLQEETTKFDSKIIGEELKWKGWAVLMDWQYSPSKEN